LAGSPGESTAAFAAIRAKTLSTGELRRDGMANKTRNNRLFGLVDR
jgi:hypothetical protein